MTKSKVNPEMHQFIMENYKGILTSELTNRINSKFGTNFTEKYIKSYKSRYKLRSGVDMRFGHGQKRHIAEKGYIHPNAVLTQFKKGHKPHNTQPIGSEVLRSDGLIWVKLHNNPGPHNIAGRWKARSRIVWEIKNGPLKDDEIILHLDGNSQNDSSDNLYVIKREQLLIINKHSLINESPELTKIGITIANLQRKINQRRKKENGS